MTLKCPLCDGMFSTLDPSIGECEHSSDDLVAEIQRLRDGIKLFSDRGNWERIDTLDVMTEENVFWPNAKPWELAEQLLQGNSK